MATDLGKLAIALPDRPAGLYVLARRAAFCVEDCVCHLHARSPVVEREHPRAAIAVMLGGAMHARGSEGEAVVGAGAILLKNPATHHEYRHVDDGGDRSITFEYEDAFLEDVRASFAVHRRARRAFDRVAIPPSAETVAAVVLARGALCSGDPDALHDAAMAVAELAIAADWSRADRLAAPARDHARRIAQILRYVDIHPAEDCSLDTLAAYAELSPFHFVRVFRAITGQTPRQYVIAAARSRAAIALETSRSAVTDVALDAGFGDLSHFITSFRRAFGVSPRRYRQLRGAPR
ncbi:MAG: helix-turn-helix transcriptional regulator [Kofleriaceae bacterium]